jgi:nucleotide-binding universal stress UspA family protein
MAFRSILVEVDDSTAAARALAWAALQAGPDGEVLAVHVLTYSEQLWRDLPPTGLTAWREKLRNDLEGPWTAPLRDAGVRYRPLVVEDDSVEHALLRVADGEPVDVIVLGARGHANLTERLLGAVTYKVAHLTRRPVVIVPTEWTPTAP